MSCTTGTPRGCGVRRRSGPCHGSRSGDPPGTRPGLRPRLGGDPETLADRSRPLTGRRTMDYEEALATLLDNCRTELTGFWVVVEVVQRDLGATESIDVRDLTLALI